MTRAGPLTPRRVFFAARRVPRTRRDAFVEKVCRENEELRRRVKALLEAADSPSGFLRPPTEAKRLVELLADEGGEAPIASRPRERGPVLAAGARIADRYVIEALVGEGSSGRVYRATDEVLRTTVAVKLLDLEAGEELEQLRREAATLRWLRVPGVVNLQDDGVDEGRPYIVTDLVVGTPFPGAAATATWASIRETAVGLLETLARIHAQGVIHGDLKPSNVLVDERGIPTVLDVGIASGPSIDFGDDEDEDVVAGTPSYMAPERIGGAPASVATDLYAVGVMLHEALCGAVPHQATNRTGLFDRRRLEDARPIREIASGTPTDAARMIDALLARDAARRPASAYDALDLLEHLRYVRPGNPDYPFLGSRELIDKLVQAAKEGRSLDIWGPPGSGKTRTLREAAKEVEALGRRVLWLRPSGTPFGSLEATPLFRGLSMGGCATEALESFASIRLASALASGVVIASDSLSDADAATRHALRRASASGCVWTATPFTVPNAVPVPTLLPEDLEGVFAGEHLLLHIPEDASNELWRCSSGRPGAALEEAASWVRAGLATWQGTQVRINREQLERLAARRSKSPRSRTPTRSSGEFVDGEAVRLDGQEIAVWPERHDRDLNARIVHTESEHAHLGHGAAATPTVSLLAGRPSRTLTSTLLELETGTRSGGGDVSPRVTSQAIEAALDLGSPAALEHLHGACVRLAPHSAVCARVAVLAKAALDAIATHPDLALATLDALDVESHPHLRLATERIRVVAARAISADEEDLAITRAAAWASRDGTRESARAIASWKGWLHYRRGRFIDATAMHDLAATQWPRDSVGFARARLAAAEARMDAGSFDAARSSASEAEVVAATLRCPVLEANAMHIRIAAGDRLGLPRDAMPAAIAAVIAVGVPHLAGQFLLMEAARDYRRPDLRSAAALATRAASMFARSQSSDGLLLARALATACQPESAPTDWFMASTVPNPVAPAITTQVWALFAAGRRANPTEALATVRSLVQSVPLEDRIRPREVLSMTECLAIAFNVASAATRAPESAPNPDPVL